MSDKTYIGRFAPSPTGPLHFGSLVAALASFLDARAHSGRWLVRIEDIDPPREQPGAATQILTTLEQYGLHWDGPVAYQHQRYHYYQEALEQLLKQQQGYYCTCSRKELAPYNGIYPGFCRSHGEKPSQPAAIRFNCENRQNAFIDRIQGQISFDLAKLGDFVIYRKDGFWAYQLAVCVDDAEQGITHIVRGSDLLDSTPRQQALIQALNYPEPHYAHLPVIVDQNGQKLSKQNLAAPLPATQVEPQLLLALTALGQHPPQALSEASRDELLDWAVANWQLNQVSSVMSIPASALN